MPDLKSQSNLKLVMIIDDSADARILYERGLSGEGFEIVTISNGAEALNWLKREPHHPDLILLDLMMPEMTGEKFMAQLRNEPSLAHIKVLLVSGWDELAKRAQDLGAIGYIQKPVDLMKLCRQVRKHVGTDNPVTDK